MSLSAFCCFPSVARTGNSTHTASRENASHTGGSSLLEHLHRRAVRRRPRRRRHSGSESDDSSSGSGGDSSDSGASNFSLGDILAAGNALTGNNEDGALCFHRTCGVNAIVEGGGRAANRGSPESEFNGAVCLTSRPLRDGELFEIEVNRVVSRWSGSLEMGVTLIEPDELEFPDTMTDVTYDTWMLSGSTVMKDGSSTSRDYGIDLDTVTPGTRIGVMRRRNGDLHFYLDGNDVGVAVRDVPPGKCLDGNSSSHRNGSQTGRHGDHQNNET